MARREAIEDIMKCIDDELIICNIGFPSRELYDIEDREENFYMIGSMGLASSIGLGLALAQPERDIVVIDGDGSLLMNMGSLVTVFANNPSNFTWIVIDLPQGNIIGLKYYPVGICLNALLHIDEETSDVDIFEIGVAACGSCTPYTDSLSGDSTD